MAKAAVQQEAVRETEDLRVRDVLRAAAREDLMETTVSAEETVQERVIVVSSSSLGIGGRGSKEC